MRTSIIKIVLVSVFLCQSLYAQGLNTSKEEAACSDIGFKAKTVQHGECVLELLARRKISKPKQDTYVNYKSSPARDSSSAIWNLRPIAGNSSSATYLMREDKSVYDTLQTNNARVIVEVADKIGRSANIKPTLFLRESSEINAGATFYEKGQPVIVINKPMYDLIVNDRDMAAALIGHETAHLYLNHPGATDTTDTIGSILGILAGVALEVVAQQKLGVASVGMTGGQLIGTAFSTSFTRDQERDADRQGIIWAKEDGYDPMGAVRLFETLEKNSGNNLIPFFQTHPNPSERIENARQTAMSL